MYVCWREVDREKSWVVRLRAARSPYRHPVLDAVEASWPTIEKAMTRGPRNEFLYEVSCYSLVALCANCRAHIPRYR